MKKVIGYLRISTKDQSNFSLSGQEKYIVDFCIKNKYELIALFSDDGKSAKNFDRPDWKKLEAFIRENKKTVDILLVSKYDRFSRDVADALKMIELLENKYAIRVLSVMEPIMLHPKSPYFFQFRTQMLLGAQVEWLVIRDRTKAGNHQAAKQGRFLSTAPFGYKNARDAQNKPILVVDEAKAMVIRKMFAMLIQGAPLREIQLAARMDGYYRKGNSAVKLTLSNCTYVGLVRVPEYYDEPGGTVKGLHEAIIDETTWIMAQQALRGRERKKHCSYIDDLPYRGVLRCFCARMLTGYKAKGKCRYFWYYRCNTHMNYNLPAQKLHTQMADLVAALSLPPQYAEYLRARVKEIVQQRINEQTNLVSEKRQHIGTLARQLDALEAKFIGDQLDAVTYKKWRDRYRQELQVEESLLADLQKPVNLILEKLNMALDRLTDLSYYFNKSDVHMKQTFLRWVFDNRLYYQDGIYRTPFLHPLFSSKAALVKEKGLLVVESPPEKIGENPVGAPEGSIIELLSPILEWATAVGA